METSPTPEADSYAFHLFRPSNASSTTPKDEAQARTTAPPKIRLESSTTSSAATVVAPRPLHYSLSTLTLRTHQQYLAAAVSGAEVLHRSKLPCPGLACPWRVVSIHSTARSRSSPPDTSDNTADASAKYKRTRIGKKTRLRRRLLARKVEERKRAAEVKAEEAKARQKEREEHLKVKKARENRRRQLKKRERAREGRKVAGDGVGSGVVDRASHVDG